MIRKEPKRGPPSAELQILIEAAELLNPHQHRARFLDAVTSELMRTPCLDALAVRQCVYAALSRIELSWVPRDG